MKTKIVHVIGNLNTGGAEMMLYRLVTSHLESSKYCHVIISLTDKGKLGERLQSKGVKVLVLNIHSKILAPFGFLNLFLRLRQE